MQEEICWNPWRFNIFDAFDGHTAESECVPCASSQISVGVLQVLLYSAAVCVTCIHVFMCTGLCWTKSVCLSVWVGSYSHAFRGLSACGFIRVWAAYQRGLFENCFRQMEGGIHTQRQTEGLQENKRERHRKHRSALKWLCCRCVS